MKPIPPETFEVICRGFKATAIIGDGKNDLLLLDTYIRMNLFGLRMANDVVECLLEN